MLPHSDEKAKESLINKRSFSLINKRHERSQSSSSALAPTQQPSTFNLENKRGWLESTPVQVTPSRSLDNRRSYNVTKSSTTNHHHHHHQQQQQQQQQQHTHRKPTKDIDLLGAVSDEDIFKLTELTSRLPEVNTNKHHTRKRSDHDENITRKRMQSEDDPVTPEKKITSPATSSSEMNESKRRSWLYKSLIKPIKKNTTKREDNQNVMSASASIAEDFYNNNPLPINNFGGRSGQLKSATGGGGGGGEPSTANNRRDSFDSFQSSFLDESDTVSKEDEELIENKEFVDYHDAVLDRWEHDHQRAGVDPTHEERPNLQSAENNEPIAKNEPEPAVEEEDVLLELKKNSSPAVNIDTLQEAEETFLFDYESIPSEVQKLIDKYGDLGKAEIKELTVKHKHGESDDDDDDDEEEEGEEEEGEETVDEIDIITGNHTATEKGRRHIAIVTTARSDNIEFTKLVPVVMEGSAHEGPFVDLHVSLFGEENSDDVNAEEFQDTIQSIEQNLERFQSFKRNADSFLVDHLETMQSLNLYSHADLPRNSSFPSLQSAAILTEEPEPMTPSSSSSLTRRTTYEIRKEKYSRNARSMYSSSSEYPFDCRQKEIMSLVNSLQNELNRFKQSLEKTEHFVNHVQLDMDDTRLRMETYIKDIPETHYSSLKKLEVDIESILTNRAKNPWLDRGYALLSYFLTLFALGVWIVIYILKLASMMSVAAGATSADDSIFQRSHRHTQQNNI
ncbi:uncharacterized protein EV154DRAFT_600847 [Mucor mucedo]|uniref:uncharacterized protein n=1 Tax=Mucor mucedo TaxID=29922 RepID=UPI002220A29A|nr:uncharacterized protein EV154DRAFT_600847 [Mucor mucedo]KAI7893580.1 hypothetical protein EV154DRAFT_600847 [Mucor mucedo]